MKSNLLIAIAVLSTAAVLSLSGLNAAHHKKGEHKHDKPAGHAKSKSPEGAMAYIISPRDGETVGTSFTVRFGLKGMGVAPAGLNMENTGHHHLMVNHKGMPDLNMPLPAGETLLHFGKGQTETVLTLKPGKHTLQLILGDHAHIPHDKPVISKKVVVTVK